MVYSSLDILINLVLLLLMVPHKAIYISSRSWLVQETDVDPAAWVDLGTIRGPEDYKVLLVLMVLTVLMALLPLLLWVLLLVNLALKLVLSILEPRPLRP